MSQISAESGETGRESLNGDGFSEDGASTVNLLGGFDLKFGTLVLPEEGLKKQDDTAQASNFKVSDTKPKPRKSRASKIVEVSDELGEPYALGNVVMPLQKQEGLEADVADIGLDALVVADLVYNKELSWLAFNWRVLHMALDVHVPLFERLRFLAISACNIDEFFCKRVGALKRQEAAGVENLIKLQPRMAWTPQQQLKHIARDVRLMVDTQIACLTEELLPALNKKEIKLVDYDGLHLHEKDQLRLYFKSALEPILTPLAVDPGHPFPYIGNLTLSIAVVRRFSEILMMMLFNLRLFLYHLDWSDGRAWNLLKLMSTFSKSYNRNAFVPVEDIIINNLDLLFGGMEIKGAYAFRTTRNADVARNEEEAEDLLEMIADEMRELRFAPFVRLEVDREMPLEVVQRLVMELGLNDLNDVYAVCGPIALGELASLPVKLEVNSSLVYTPWTPKTHPRIQGADIFEVIRKGDILLHHPYHSFVTSIQHFVEAAANDPKVMAIKATLYRTSNDSPVISALAKAAESGKQVAVLVELKARFDEERNIGFAQKLEDACCNVVYGLIGLKTHCKCILVVRKEDDGLRTYVHIGTGNYNPRTASVYTDFGLLSCDPDLGMDVINLFKYLTGYHRQVAYLKLLVSPGTMRNEFVWLIEREIVNAQMGKPASIIVKCNGLDDQVMVTKLYEASKAGVKVDCIVRGMCRIRTGIPNVSDNIRVVSIIGRFLEHHRVMRFENGGKAEYYMGSADWMNRNLTRRVEVVVPVEAEPLQKELQEMLDACLCDRRNAWEMRPDGRYQLLGIGTMKTPPREHTPQAASSKLAATVENKGLHEGLMEIVAKRCRKARKLIMGKRTEASRKLVIKTTAV
ncbi:uncharacterized protein [Physcomitrium patens]|uniref:uncharacterized protein isoform X1 n=1 Tax=Physcomitrium patens TaxID=3218 RepID=UPI000D15E9CC|nr:uncharacterized protein LOC112291913 isoform X1 [Physcomitrium patens]|eukprot:XP_024395664.1 uncharacterized protein LOC112291913 isoform X1 [Physcomitrella patens]